MFAEASRSRILSWPARLQSIDVRDQSRRSPFVWCVLALCAVYPALFAVRASRSSSGRGSSDIEGLQLPVLLGSERAHQGASQPDLRFTSIRRPGSDRVAENRLLALIVRHDAGRGGGRDVSSEIRGTCRERIDSCRALARPLRA